MALAVGLTVANVMGIAHASDEEWTLTRAFRTFSKSTWRGLPQSSVLELAQDSNGVLWIGTLDGVASFDGRTITPVESVAGAPVRGVISSIVARKRGGVAVGSAAGAHLYDGHTWQLAASRRGVASLTETRDGRLWMADIDGAIWTLDSGSVWSPHPEVKIAASALAAAPDGDVWAATADSAIRIHDGTVTAVAGPPLPSRPRALLVASDGRIWIATTGGTVHWTNSVAENWQQAAFTPWPRAAFRALTEDRRGRIWAASYSGGIAFGTAGKPWTVWGAANGPFEGNVMSVLADREGTIWFGNNGIGLTQWVGEGWSHRISGDPLHPHQQGFSAFGLSPGIPKHSLLVSLFTYGLLTLSDGPLKQETAAQGLTQDVRHVVQPEPGLRVAGARFGIFESRDGARFQQVVTLPSGFVMGFYRGPDARWYAGTSSVGILVREAGKWRPVPEMNRDLDDLHVRGMTWRRNGELWVATLRGITIFRNGKPVEHLTSRNERALPESVNAVLELPDDEMWAGGPGGLAIRKGGRWQRLTEANGIPGQTIYSLARGLDGSVWTGGSAGVGRYKAGKWTVWDSRQGLLQEECNLNGLVVLEDGGVYVGTMGGLAHFDPSVVPLARPPLKLI